MSLRNICLTLAACTALTGCLPAPPSSAPAPAPELKLVTYQVDPALSPKVQGVLRRLLQPHSDEARGTLSEAPGGHIAVLAPASVHEGVAAMVAELQTSATDEAAPANLRFSYWVVQGTPAAGDQPQSEAGLAPLEATLAAVRGWDGPQDFSLVGHSTLTSLDSDRGAAHSGRLRVSQVAALDPATGTILADIDLELELGIEDAPRPELDTRVQLEPGQTLVLSTLDGHGRAGAHLYVVVRAELLTGG